MKKEFDKKFIFMILIGLILIGSFSFVLGQTPTGAEAGESARSFFEWISDFIVTLLFGASWDEGSLDPRAAASHLFLGIILIVLIYSIIDTLGLFSYSDGINNLLNWLMSIFIGIISLIAMPADFLAYVLPGYGAMGAAMTSVIPFLIIFWFSIKTKSIAMAQLVWLFFTIYFVGFYILTAVGVFQTAGDWVDFTSGIIYIIIGIAGLVMMFLIPLVRHIFKKAELDDVKEDIIFGGELNAALIKARALEGGALTRQANAARRRRNNP